MSGVASNATFLNSVPTGHLVSPGPRQGRRPGHLAMREGMNSAGRVLPVRRLARTRVPSARKTETDAAAGSIQRAESPGF